MAYSKSLPSITKRMSNLALTMAKAAQQTCAGKPFRAEPSLVALRAEICEGCAFFDKKQDLCGQCGCLMPLKIRLHVAKCPLELW